MNTFKNILNPLSSFYHKKMSEQKRTFIINSLFKELVPLHNLHFQEYLVKSGKTASGQCLTLDNIAVGLIPIEKEFNFYQFLNDKVIKITFEKNHMVVNFTHKELTHLSEVRHINYHQINLSDFEFVKIASLKYFNALETILKEYHCQKSIFNLSSINEEIKELNKKEETEKLLSSPLLSKELSDKLRVALDKEKELNDLEKISA